MPKFPVPFGTFWHLAITKRKDAYIKARAFPFWLFSQSPTKDWDLIMREMWEKSFQNLLGFVLIAKNGDVVAKLAERLPARFLGIKHLSTIDTNATGFDFAYSNEFIHVVEYTECFTVLVDPEGHFKQVGIGKQRIVSENIRPFTQNQQCGIFRNLIRKTPMSRRYGTIGRTFLDSLLLWWITIGLPPCIYNFNLSLTKRGFAKVK